MSEERHTFGTTPSARNYFVGLALALLLTAAAFGLVWFQLMPRSSALVAIAVLAVVQILVHFRYILHIDLKRTPQENLLTLALAVVVIGIMVAGCLWIMFDLNSRMAM